MNYWRELFGGLRQKNTGADGGSAAKASRGVRGISTLAVMALITGLLVSIGATPTRAIADEPGVLSCSAGAFYSVGERGVVIRIDGVNGSSSSVGSFSIEDGHRVNALAVPAGGGDYLWSVNRMTGNVLRYDAATNETSSYPALTPEASENVIAGALNPVNGVYYFAASTPNTTTWSLYAFDTNENTLIGQVGTISGVQANGDIAFDKKGNLYTVGNNDPTAAGALGRITGPIGSEPGTTIFQVNPITELPGESGQYTSAAYLSDGTVVIGTGTGNLLSVNPESGEIVTRRAIEGAAFLDFASCAYPNLMTAQKNLPSGRAAAGDQFEVSLTGPGIDDAYRGVTTGNDNGVQSGESEIAGPAQVLDGETYSISETAAGTTDLADYRTSWKCTNEATETLLAEGTGTEGSVEVPTSADAADIVCEFVNIPYNRSLAIEKTSTATENSRPGDTVTYTVTATNNGEADYTQATPAVLIDNLAGVLDDATYNGDAEANKPGSISYGAPQLKWTGSLAVGESVALTYTATLRGGGDGNVRNVAWQPKNPATPEVPTCDAVTDGVDDQTGEPCAATQFSLPKLRIDKRADRTDLPSVGEQVTYTVTVTNDGPGVYTTQAPASFSDDLTAVLDAATFSNDASATVGNVSYTEPTLTWEGALGRGESATVTYTVTYTGDGDHILRNLACVPESDVALGASRCSFVQIPGAGLIQWKQVQSSATPATAGSVLTYTLFFLNTGEAAATVDALDDLGHVTDDADVTSEPVASDGLTAVRTGDRVAVTGQVDPGETASVTYQVTVKADGERGDNVAANFLMDNDPDSPPATPEQPQCAPEDTQFPDCTSTPISAVTYSKSVEASASPMGTGTVLTYTITVENTGAVAGPVAREDVLTGVLDDAELTRAPESNTESVTVSAVENERFSIGGQLDAGATAIITYQVTVKPEADRGDNNAQNFLVSPGANPPGECVAGSTECTVSLLPLVAATKSSNPATGSTVTAGQQIDYTLTFTNTGKGTGSVAYTDDLSGVVDDATLMSGPDSSNAALTAVLNANDTIGVTGELASGQTVEVTYTVEVGPDGQRGDNRLGNVLAKTGIENPSCEDAGVECTTHLVPQLESWKQVESNQSPVRAGSVLTYTLFFENTGEAAATVDAVDDLAHVTDDADVTSEPETTGGVSAVRSGNRIAITGEVEPGVTASVTYKVTVKADDARGDNIAANFLLKNDPDNPPVTPTYPACQPGSVEKPDCTATPIGKLATSKSVSASSPTIEEGTVLTYTLTFDNQGAGPIGVNHKDVLVDVLDDAELTSQPVASDDALTVGEVADGHFTVTGELAAGHTTTVTYQVTVKADSARGNNSVSNFLLPAGGEPLELCTPADPNCTVTPLSLIGVAKAANPETGSAVQAGQGVDYTLTFTNSGTAAGTVDYSDDLASVLDDATLSGTPTTSDPALRATSGADGVVRVTGSLEPGQSVTVTYSVKVKPDGQRGDNTLRNLVAKTGTESPSCEDAGVSCTEHSVGELSDWKTVSPSSGTTVQAGSELTYTLHFENTGTAPVQVNREDNLTAVLDDASVTGTPSATSDALAVTDVKDGRLQVTGTLQPGQSETVTYTVKVKPDGQRGDDRLANFLLAPGAQVPTECAPADGNRPDCTVNHVSNVTVAKSSDPATGTQVNPGDKVTYTLTFTNISQSAGSAPVAVDYTDHLADVLDDATVTEGPTASHEDLAVARTSDGIHVTGSVPSGETFTVTYTVTVKDRADLGNSHVKNVVAVTGEEPVCAPDSPLCTEHEVSPASAAALPNTGWMVSGAMALGVVALLAIGGALVFFGRRRTVVGAHEDNSPDDVS